MGISNARAIFSKVAMDGTGMPVLDSGDVAPQKPCSLLDVALAELLLFSKFAESFAYDPCRNLFH
jgi:hypothetical protein